MIVPYFQADAKMEEMLLECSVVTEYVDAILLDERESLEDPAIFQFMQHYYPKVHYYHIIHSSIMSCQVFFDLAI